MRHLLVVIALLGMVTASRASAQNFQAVGLVAYGPQLQKPADGEGSITLFSAYTFSREAERRICWGFSLPEQTLKRIDVTTGDIVNIPMPIGTVLHDIIVVDGVLWAYQDRNTLSHPTRAVLYEVRTGSMTVRQYDIRHGLGELDGRPIGNSVHLQADASGNVLATDVRGPSIVLVSNGSVVPVEQQAIIASQAMTVGTIRADKVVGTIALDDRNVDGKIITACYRESAEVGSFTALSRRDEAYRSLGPGYHPISTPDGLEIWSILQGRDGLTFVKQTIGG